MVAVPNDPKACLRILFLAPDVRLSEQDGQATHTMELCKALTDLGCELLLIVAEANPPDPLPHGVRIEGIHNLGRRALRDSLKLGVHFAPDVLLERRGTPKLGARISRALEIPYFLEINGLVEAEAGRIWPRFTCFASRRLKGLYRQCSAVFVPTAGLGRALAMHSWFPGEKLIVVPNGVDLVQFRPIATLAARRALQLDPSLKIVLFVGKIVPWQGLDTLLDATSSLADTEDLLVVILGDGPLVPILKEKIKRNNLVAKIHLAGSVPHSRVPLWIASSDVCVAPFTRERNELIEISPLKLYEYLAMGKPIVVSDVPGVRSVVRDAGILVPPGSAEELSRALSTMLGDPDRSREVGSRGIAYARESSWGSRAEKIVKAINEHGRIVR